MPLKLCVYDPKEDFDEYPPNSMMSIEDYLNSPPHWRADLYEMVVFFDELPMNVIDDMNTFGVLQNILPQLQEIKERLLQNKFALLRTVGEHTALFFILRPIDDKVFFSTYNKFPSDYLPYFPIKDSPMFYSDGRNQQALLYEFVENENNSTSLLNKEFTILENIKNVEMDLNALIDSIENQIVLGYRLINVELGKNK